MKKPQQLCSQLWLGQWYCYVLLVLYSLALPLGIVGNITALLSYTCFLKTWTTSKIFLLNLALCDLAWLLTLPFGIYFSLRQPSERDMQIFCKFKKMSFNVNVYGSIFFLTLISFDRYTGTVHPISSLKWWSARRAKVCCASVWAMLVVGSIPELFFTFNVDRKANVTVCMDHVKGPYVYLKILSIARTLVGFILPFSIMLPLYVLTAKVLCNLYKAKRVGLRSAKPLKLLSAAIVVFTVSFVPYHVAVVVLVFMRLSRRDDPANANKLYTYYEFSEALCSIGSCLDPLLYILASERFHKHWLAATRHCCRRRGKVRVKGGTLSRPVRAAWARPDE